jgi:SulP family sulfate permease
MFCDIAGFTSFSEKIGTEMLYSILLNSSGVEFATQSESNLDKELRVNGAASIISDFCGGMVGYISISRSLLNFKAGAQHVLAGVTAGLCCIGVFLFYGSILTYLPKPVLAGFLFYIG